MSYQLAAFLHVDPVVAGHLTHYKSSSVTIGESLPYQPLRLSSSFTVMKKKPEKTMEAERKTGIEGAARPR